MPNDPNDFNKEIQDVERSPIFQILFQQFGRSPLGAAILVIGAVLVVVFGGVFLNGSNNSGGTSPTVLPGNTVSPTRAVAPGNPGAGQSSPGGLPAQSFKQTPKEITYNGCPPQGDGGDPVLNNNKNRVDDGNYQPTAFNSILNLGWPSDVERTDHAKWSASSAAKINQSEGLPVLVEGYLALARAEGPETPNCHSETDIDFHIWMLANAGGSADRVNAVVIEMTPRVRANHPGWTTSILNKIASSGTRIRVGGWLMLDPEHPDQVGKTRGTIWEIHPVMKVDVFSNNQWVPLDNYKG